jgi:hypothetical protein
MAVCSSYFHGPIKHKESTYTLYIRIHKKSRKTGWRTDSSFLGGIFAESPLSETYVGVAPKPEVSYWSSMMGRWFPVVGMED